MHEAPGRSPSSRQSVRRTRKSSAAGPPIRRPPIRSLAVPRLVRVSSRLALAGRCTVPYSRRERSTSSSAAVPLPARAIACSPRASSDSILSSARRLPAPRGWKSRSIEQRPPGCRVEPVHPSRWMAKEERPAPEMTERRIASGALPELRRVAERGALSKPARMPPKSTSRVSGRSRGETPFPASATWVLPCNESRTLRVAVARPSAEGVKVTDTRQPSAGATAAPRQSSAWIAKPAPASSSPTSTIDTGSWARFVTRTTRTSLLRPTL